MTEEKYISFNVNDDIKVKLTEAGYQHMADIHNKYIGWIPKWRKRTASYYKKRADAEGYTRFSMWSFMHDFGDRTFMGCEMLFETTILIKTDA